MCCVLLYQLIVDLDLSHAGRLSFTTFGILSVVALCFVVVEIIYLGFLFKGFSVGAAHRDASVLYFSSLLIGTFSTYYIGLASFIFLTKRVLRITYEEALTVSMLDLFMRYSLKGLFAAAGLAGLIGIRSSLWIGVALLVATLCGLVLIGGARRLLRRHKGLTRLRDSLATMKEVLRSVDRRRMVPVFVLACAALVLEGLIFYIILKQLGYRTNLGMILCVKSLGLFIGYLSLVPTMNLVEDLSVIGLWMLVGLDQNVAAIAVVINRIFFTGIPFLLSIVAVNVFFKGYLDLLREAKRQRETP